MCEFGMYLYNLNPKRGCLQQFRNALFGIILLLPELKSGMGRSRKLEKGWDRSVPAHSPPPLSLTSVNALCAWLASQGKFRQSLAINLGFHAFLRANEICRLRCADICFPGDPRLSDFRSTRAGCIVRHAKTGKNQFVSILDIVLLRRLKRFVLSHPHRHGSLFCLSYALLMAVFKTSLEHFHLHNTGYTLHSLRHGGATFDWLNGNRLEDVMLKGRWSSEKSCKHYLNAGKALLVRTSLPSRSALKIKTFASRRRATAVEERVERARALH